MQALIRIWKIQLNNLSEKENIDNGNLANLNYRDISYFSNLDVELKSKCLSFFHLNINSLSKNFDNFNHLINKLKLEFDILGISESRILKPQSLNTNFSLHNYVVEQTPTESTAIGALLYIKNGHSYKTCLILPFISQKNLNQFLLKLFYPRKATWLLDVFINTHAQIYAHLMIIILIQCWIIFPRKPIKQLFS